jgi:proline dehydrogenase
MLRGLLLALSRNAFIRERILRLGLAKQASRRFVAGEEPADAIRAIQELNKAGIVATLDHLGEDVATEAEARQAAADYLDILDRIRASGVTSHVSAKLTQMGLDISGDLCQSNVEAIAAKAGDCGTFLRIDMEGSPHTERTIKVYEAVRAKYPNVGIVIQAYLYRSEKDIQHLIDAGIANIRLCKGAYLEPASIAFPKKADVDRNMIRLAEMLLNPETRAKGAYLAFATHDEKLINWAKQYATEHNIPKTAFEFQMLYGIRRDLHRKLAQEGYTMRVYVPYGHQWYPYFMRRLAERPANVLFIIRNLLR